MCHTTVGCDEAGIWREDRPGVRMHIPWNEVTRVTAEKIDCITRIDTILSLDHESGHFFEINDQWRGYDEVVAAIKQQYTLEANWHAAVTNLGPRDRHVVIWQRDDYPAS